MAVTSSQKLAKRAEKKKTKVSAAKLETLQKLNSTNRDEFGQPKRTRQNYAGYIERGKRFLAELIEERRKVENEEGENEGLQNNGMDTNVLEKAFENPPNRYSATALELFLVQKCFTEHLGVNTAVGIHGAFANYWDTMESGKYAGAFQYDEDTHTVLGCPARAENVKSLLKVVRNKYSTKGGSSATRHHAEAMTIEELQMVMEWSAQQRENIGTAGQQNPNLEQLKVLVKHTLMEAFLSSGYTLWTRNFELCQLQRGDLVFDLTGPAPHHHPFFLVRLTNRKGWQNKQGFDGPLENNTYEIYKQDIGALDMFTWLPKWIDFLEERLGRSLEDDDYIFPYFGTNSVPYPKKQMTHDVVQALLTEFTQKSGLTKRFTTHCLRRGGAQYRLMYAELGKRWSLSIIRWWGGWAVGEHVDTLMKYLLDSLQSYESGHGNALCPTRLDVEQSFLAEHQLVKPATLYDLNTATETLITALKTTQASVNHSPTPSIRLPTVQLARENTNVASLVYEQAVSHLHFTPIKKPSPEPPTDSVSPFSADQHSCPLPGVYISNLGRGPDAWRKAVRQWEDGNPITGEIALKDWPIAWYTGEMRTIHGPKRSTRQLIAEEYARLNRDDNLFLTTYPAAKHITKLLNAIRENNQRRRTSKNGTPFERSRMRSPVAVLSEVTPVVYNIHS